MLTRLRAAIHKEFAQFFRAKALVLLVLYVFAETANCAWVLTMDVRDLPLLVVDQDGTSASRALSERFRIAPYFAYRRATGQVEPAAALDEGTAALVVVIPPGFARALDRGEPVRVQLLADGTYSNFGQLALGYAGEIIGDYSAAIRADWAVRHGPVGVMPGIVNQVRLWYMPGLEYTHWLMLSMLGSSAVILGILLPAAAIVREKEAGTLEQVLVTPLRSGELVAAKLLPMGLLMIVGLVIGLLEAVWLFGTPIQGSLTQFFGLAALLFFAAMGIGAVVGALAHNLLQTLLLTFALLFPMLFLSGTMAPIENMPVAMQWLTYLSPLRYYLPLAEGVLFKGTDWTMLATNAIGLVVYGLVAMAIGVRQLRRALAG